MLQNMQTQKEPPHWGIVGFDGGQLINKCKYNVHVPSHDMQLCEDVHLIIGHMITKDLADFKIS